jgi:uncharacterized protein (DUF3820 family)
MNTDHLQLLLTREMPYGKYKGRKIAALPGHYLGWFAREGFPNGELGQLLALSSTIMTCAACSIRCGAPETGRVAITPYQELMQ